MSYSQVQVVFLCFSLQPEIKELDGSPKELHVKDRVLEALRTSTRRLSASLQLEVLNLV